MRLWVTRTAPAAHETAARVAALGHTPLVAPLLVVRPLPLTGPVPDHAVLAFTSRNAVVLWSAHDPDRTRPVYCVGDATAEAARAAGYTDVHSASGDVRDLAALIRPDAAGAVLAPGPASPAADLAAQVGGDTPVHTLAVYETVEADDLAPDAFDGVLFHAPRAAAAFAQRHAGTAPGRLAFAMSPAVAAPLGALGFSGVRVAARPDEQALIDTLDAQTLGKPPHPV